VRRDRQGPYRPDEFPLDGGGTVAGRAVELIALKEDEQVLLTLAVRPRPWRGCRSSGSSARST
jgi:hypothetical protein